jgi:hypothetical protein
MVILGRMFSWRDALLNVKPDRFLLWRRKGLRLFWRWKSRPPGRPRPPKTCADLIHPPINLVCGHFLRFAKAPSGMMGLNHALAPLAGSLAGNWASMMGVSIGLGLMMLAESCSL